VIPRISQIWRSSSKSNRRAPDSDECLRLAGLLGHVRLSKTGFLPKLAQ
jgi:hypothetical protein